MRAVILASVVALLPASAALALPSAGRPASMAAEPAQFSRGESRDFRRCMRAKFGPHYFRGVKRAHRTFMAQACGG